MFRYKEHYVQKLSRTVKESDYWCISYTPGDSKLKPAEVKVA